MGPIPTPKIFLGPIPPPQKLFGTYSNFQKNCVGLFPPHSVTPFSVYDISVNRLVNYVNQIKPSVNYQKFKYHDVSIGLKSNNLSKSLQKVQKGHYDLTLCLQWDICGLF